MTSATRKLCLLHLSANALLMWLGYEWLSVAESTRLRLAVSAADALAILALVCWLHGATFVYFRDVPKINEAFRVALRHLAALVTAAILVLVLYGLLRWAAGAAAQPAFRLASWLTLHLHKPVKPASVARVLQALFWIVRWIVLPVVLLPAASAIASRGWRGFGAIMRGSPLRYWVAVPVLLLIGLQLPFVLLRWVPAFDSFALQFTSFAIRLMVAYLLFVAAALRLAIVSGSKEIAP
uniref:Uncharacterized protein n=1 Tax=Solibacter usitatus (strain Ellin6076) TaxID=234267 RepID=Q025N1_SOLUE